MNSIDRMYSMRGKQVRVRELADLVAVRAERKGQKPALTGPTLESLAPGLDLPQFRALEDAGWVFVQREHVGDGAPVYLRPSGRVALGTDRLTVRVTGSRSPQEAEEWLAEQGLEVLNRLKFASNLFVVRIPPGRDPMSEAERLLASRQVEFAEPEMIESLTGR